MLCFVSGMGGFFFDWLGRRMVESFLVRIGLLLYEQLEREREKKQRGDGNVFFPHL